MVSLLHPLQLSTFTIFIICISFHTSDGKHGDNYKDCSSLVSCGNVTNIGYPFWGAGRPLNCGHPALQILCLRNGSNDYPTINITLQELGIQHEYGDETLSHRMLHYQKKSNQETMSITIKLQKLILQNTCFLSFNITGPDEINLFEYSADFQNISLVYGKDCFNQKMLAGHPSFKCSDNKNNNITVYYLQNQTVWGHNKSKQSCELIQYPVPPGKELDDLRSGDWKALFNVLNQEFEVDYSRNYSDLCFKCEDSGGVCGSLPYSEFACHCKNSGPQLYRCPKGKLKLILGLAIPGGILMFIVLNVALCYWKKPKFHSPNSLSRLILSDPVNSNHEINWSIYGIPVFSYDELQEATNTFDQTQELGDGGFGVVYYGKLRDGREVAVKRLYERNFKRVGQFLNEVEILTKLRHKNLVTLYGCTSSHSRENLLVYEYIPNGTVADHLYGEKSGSKALSWTVRMKIAIETATALSYLHASDIIHRDVKTNNILLDNNFLVKVADFGLSRLFPLDATHVSTAPQGTPGYLDPEYHKCYQVTSKSDVYSFGVVLIELISSLPPIDVSRNESEINLSDFAMKRIQKGDLDKLVDQQLGFETDFKVKRMTTLVAELAFQCLQQEREVRPSMEEVLKCLKQIESTDYEVIEAEETTRNVGGRNPDSANDVDQALRTTQQPRSPSSVFETWVSSSTATNPSS